MRNNYNLGISIVVIFSDKHDDVYRLHETVKSINLNETVKELICVIRCDEKLGLELQNSYPEVKFIINQDTSLFNAMNLGCLASSYSHSLVLPCGDKIINQQPLDELDLKHDECYFFSSYLIDLMTHNKFLWKPSKKEVGYHCCHQSIVLPRLKNGVFAIYPEDRWIDADKYCILDTVNESSAVDLGDNIIVEFELGGLSNNPSFKLLKYFFERFEIVELTKEMVKYFIFKMLPRSSYYKFIYSRQHTLINHEK